MAKEYDMDRLGGPPGLFNSPNWDRNGNGGIVQRVRVPADTSATLYPVGRYQTDSLNDSTSLLDAEAENPAPPAQESREDLECGIPFRKDITGSNM